MKDYYNSKGERVLIEDMPNHYLLNALAKSKTRLDLLNKKLGAVSFGFAKDYKKRLEETVESLRSEVKKRGLV